MTISAEFFISVDVETAGPNPADYAMLSIGACTLDDPPAKFYIELKPTFLNYKAEALEVSGLSMKALEVSGVPPKEGMKQFDRWIHQVTSKDKLPVFTAFNAAFDWMFVNDYFHHYLGHNPFGHKALDIKALYMGIRKTGWQDTSFHLVSHALGINTSLTHHALEDAIQQAMLLKVLLKELEGE